MPELFSPLVLGGLTLRNRIVVSPMAQYRSDPDGCAGDWHLMHLGHLALSGAGLLMTEATAVTPEGRGSLQCLGLYGDEQEQALRRVVQACKQWEGARLGVQLSHTGRKGSIRPPWAGRGPLPLDEGGWRVAGPSAIAADPEGEPPLMLEPPQLQRLVRAFAAAAERAVRAGFDVIELHAAHGYLLHQFLSPLSNQRSDGYGGDRERRQRFPLEVVEAVRAVVPRELALGLRISASDWAPGGFEVDDAIAFAGALKDMGCDYVCVSSGGLVSNQKIPLSPGYQVPFAAAVRRATGLTVRAVGLISLAGQADAIVRDGSADCVALARAMLDDPRWPWHAAELLGATVAYPKPYERASRAHWNGPRMLAGGERGG